MRISNLYIKNNSIQTTNKNTQKMDRIQNQLLSSKKNQAPSDDPLGIITSLYHRVRINQIDQYQESISNTQSHIDIEHDKISSISEIVRHIRQRTLQAANGTLTNEDRINIAVEIEQSLQEMLSLANSKHQDNYLFSGTKTDIKPFLEQKAHDNKLGMPITKQVSYMGDGLAIKRDVDFNKEISLNNSGAKVFWAQNHSIVAKTDAQNYISANNQTIAIDGYTVDILAGEDISTIVQKINDTVPTANAFVEELETGEKTLGIEANFPHKLQIEDREGGSLLRDLGILKEGNRGQNPFENINENTIVHDGSIFEAIIRLRDSITNNEIENISSRDLGALTQGYQNIIKNQAKISATKWSLASTSKDLSIEKIHSIARKSQVEDVNMVEAMIKYNELSNVHQVSLQTAARLTRRTLLDYI